MNRVKNVLLMLILTAVSTFSGTITLSMQDAVARTMEHLPALHSANVSADDARERSRSAEIAWYPTINGECDYARVVPAPELAFGGSKLKMSPDNVYDAHIGLSWEVWDFGRRAIEKESAKAGVVLADDRINSLKSAVSYQIASIFQGISYDESAMAVEDSLVAALVAHRDFIQRQVASGSAISYDLSKTEVRIGGAQSQKLLIINDLNRRMIQLREWIGLENEDSLVLMDVDTVLKIPPARSDTLVAIALASRQEMKLAKDAERIAVLKATTVASAGLPSLGMQCNAGIKDGYPVTHNKEIGLEDPTPNATAGLRLTVPIWDGDRLKSRRTQAEFAIQIARDSIEGVKRRITQDVLGVFTDCKSSWEQIRLAEGIVGHADLVAEAARLRYESGMATNLEYLDAQADRAQTLLTWLGYRFRHILNGIALRQATGMPAF